MAAAEDSSCETSQRRMYRGLADALASEQFVLNIGLMLDCLEELKNVSTELQKDDITLSRAYRVSNRTIRAILQMKDKSAQYTKEALCGIERSTGTSSCRVWKTICAADFSPPSLQTRQHSIKPQLNKTSRNLTILYHRYTVGLCQQIGLQL